MMARLLNADHFLQRVVETCAKLRNGDVKLSEKYHEKLLKSKTVSHSWSSIQINVQLVVVFVAGLGEFKLRDLNDEINKLLREKGHWEDQILTLGGPDYRVFRFQHLFDQIQNPSLDVRISIFL